MPFVKLVGQVREAQTESARHELRFSKLVEELQIARDSSYHPVTQVRFAYKSAAASGSPGVSPAGPERGGLSLAGEPPGLPEAAFDLECSVAEGKGGLTFELKY